MSNDENLQQKFDRVYSENVLLLLRIAARITGSESSGEDVCQEAFFRYYERIGSVPDGLDARYWLIRVVKNLSLNYEKRKERERHAYWKLGQQPIRDMVNDGEEDLLLRETTQAVREALQGLSPKYRMVLILKEYENMSYKEIGESLKLSESNVKIRVFRAREQLSKTLNKGDYHVPR